MSTSSTRKAKKIPMRALDPVLANRIKQLRNSLGLLQAQFAEKLNVSPTQISEWEKGTKERPSVEKLLDMASMALTEEAREWFWRKAGVDLESIKAHFRAKIRRQTNQWEAGQYLRIPIIRELKVGANGELMGIEEAVLDLPVEELSNPASLICLKCVNRAPWVMRDGCRVIVDRSITSPQTLLGQMTAVFFERFPLLRDNLLRSRSPVSRFDFDMVFEEFLEKIDPGGFWSDDPERRRRRELIREEAKQPGFLVGRLDVEGVDRPSLHKTEPDVGPWRLVLTLHAPLTHIDEVIPLSKWETTNPPGLDPSIPLAPLIPKSVRIIGKVVMDWFAVEDDGPTTTEVRKDKSKRP